MNAKASLPLILEVRFMFVVFQSNSFNFHDCHHYVNIFKIYKIVVCVKLIKISFLFIFAFTAGTI